MMKQVRKALDDIQQSINDDMNDDFVFTKAALQIYYLRKMIDEQPSRQKPWSHYQPMIDEEFG